MASALCSVLCLCRSIIAGDAFSAGYGLCKGIWNCTFEKNSFTHLFPLQPCNKIHPHCLAFTFRALWVSLSLACTTERVNLWLQWTGLCKRFTSLSQQHGALGRKQHWGGNSTGIRASRADQGPMKHSICVPSQCIISVLQPCYQPHTQRCLFGGVLAACLNTARSTLVE